MKLKQNCMKFDPNDLEKFKVIARTRGLSMAAYLRFLVAREIRRAVDAQESFNAPRRNRMK